MELAGCEVTCPVCGKGFTVSGPLKEAQKTARIVFEPEPDGQKGHWVADVRVLVINAPPSYIQLLIEVPHGWTLPMDGNLPGEALEAVRKVVGARFPHSPVTLTKVRVADAAALRRSADHPDYAGGFCRVWSIGKGSSI